MDAIDSGLHLYSLGIVLEDKPEGTDKIKVLPIEHLSQFNGLLSEANISHSNNMPDSRGVAKTGELKGGPDMVASWIPDGSDNRITSPDVRRSETVKIYRMGDTNDFYWTTVFREPGLRRQETIMYAASNLKEGLEKFDPTTSYWTLIDTRHKKYQIHTSNNDSEPFAFDILIDTAAGHIVIQDDVGNNIMFDPKNDFISLKSIAGANIDLDKGHIKGHGITISLTADEKITMTAPEVEINGDTTTVNGETTNNGSYTVNGPTALNQGMAVKGTSSLSGDLTTEGGSVTLQGGDIIMTGGTITANGEDLTVDLT